MVNIRIPGLNAANNSEAPNRAVDQRTPTRRAESAPIQFTYSRPPQRSNGAGGNAGEQSNDNDIFEVPFSPPPFPRRSEATNFPFRMNSLNNFAVPRLQESRPRPSGPPPFPRLSEASNFPFRMNSLSNFALPRLQESRPKTVFEELSQLEKQTAAQQGSLASVRRKLKRAMKGLDRETEEKLKIMKLELDASKAREDKMKTEIGESKIREKMMAREIRELKEKNSAASIGEVIKLNENCDALQKLLGEMRAKIAIAIPNDSEEEMEKLREIVSKTAKMLECRVCLDISADMVSCDNCNHFIVCETCLPNYGGADKKCPNCRATGWQPQMFRLDDELVVKIRNAIQ